MKNQELNPVWNEIFAMDVETGKEKVEITVFGKSNFGNDDFMGSFNFSLGEFIDQGQHDMWFDLEGPKNSKEIWTGKIRVIV